ncbi:MAG: nucleotidyl transferase AbiEii/AbiGii toxin family protein [Blastocatellia bacterium]|nr:nucleotidyl transferase AbiEii/AbiGii toxin family protein [Blastocatellia bacterium]
MSLRPHVLVEVTTSEIQLSPVDLPVSSFVHEVAKRPPEGARIGCIDPVESAADKLSAIAWRIPDRIRGGQSDDPSLVRHVHDLAILKARALNDPRFPTLVIASMQQDLHRPRNDRAIAGLPMAEKFLRMFDVLRTDGEYAREYARFVEGVSYATSPKERPSFTLAINALKRQVDSLGVGDEA